MRHALAAAGILALMSHPGLADSRSFTVQFSNCTEFAGEGYVPLDLAQPLVPYGYTITHSSPNQAPMVVRITSCSGVQVEHGPFVPTTISQIGINIVSPDGTGTINNYMLVYVTDNPALVRAFASAGIPASYDPAIIYQYTRATTGNSGTLYGAVPNGGIPAYFIYGPETEPLPNSAQLFIANWWHGARAASRQQTTFPAISFGTSAVTLYTSNTSVLGKLIGGNSYSNFSLLALRGEYANAEMVVTSGEGE